MSKRFIIPNWNAPKNIKAISSTRLEGLSKGHYHGLNLGTHVNDDPELVAKNRALIESDSSMPSSPIWLNQIHSTKVINLDEIIDLEDAIQLKNSRQLGGNNHLEHHDPITADASTTSTQGKVCVVMTADCLPVLLTNKQGTQVAAVHAGWRGLVDGIVENAVNMFDVPSDVIAWIGPAIGAQAFEVGEEVKTQFVHHDQKAEQAFVFKEIQDGKNKYLADMNQLVSQRLHSVGVNDIYLSNLCTFDDAEHFYSYRRDGVTGRQASFIWIETS